MKRLFSTMALASTLHLACTGLAAAQEPYVGEVRLLGFNFCPVGWLSANGALLPINQFAALFSLYGTTYGGNGTTNFGLPDLIGRAPTGFGPPPGPPLGAQYGAPSVTLLTQNLPPHTHQLFGSTAAGATYTPTGGITGTFPATDKVYAPAGSPANAPYATNAIGLTGNGVPVQTQSPSLAMNWCVAYVGIFPSRP